MFFLAFPADHRDITSFSVPPFVSFQTDPHALIRQGCRSVFVPAIHLSIFVKYAAVYNALYLIDFVNIKPNCFPFYNFSTFNCIGTGNPEERWVQPCSAGIPVCCESPCWYTQSVIRGSLQVLMYRRFMLFPSLVVTRSTGIPFYIASYYHSCYSLSVISLFVC